MRFQQFSGSRRAMSELQRADTGLKLRGHAIYVFEFKVSKPSPRWPTAWSVVMPSLNMAAVNNEKTDGEALKLADRVAALTAIPLTS